VERRQWREEKGRKEHYHAPLKRRDTAPKEQSEGWVCVRAESSISDDDSRFLFLVHLSA
jgi:hypothetical protein